MEVLQIITGGYVARVTYSLDDAQESPEEFEYQFSKQGETHSLGVEFGDSVSVEVFRDARRVLEEEYDLDVLGVVVPMAFTPVFLSAFGDDDDLKVFPQ
jgi:hypothetical protein